MHRGCLGDLIKKHMLVGRITKGARESALVANSQETLMLLPVPVPHLKLQSHPVQHLLAFTELGRF